MRRVGDEASFALACPLERCQHLVQRRREPTDLVVALGLGQPASCVAGPLDLRRRPGQASERRKGATHRERKNGGGGGSSDERCQENEQANAVERLLEIVGRRGDGDCSSRRRAASVGEGRDVHAQLIRSELRGRVPAPPTGDDPTHDVLHRENATAEGKRSGHDPPPPVDHLRA